MADPVFFHGIKFSGGAAVRKEKQRVVTKTIRAAWLARDLTVPESFGDEGSFFKKHDYAGVVGLAIVFQVGKKLGVVPRIALFAIAFAAGVVGRMHAGRAAERVDAQARIVGERRQAGGTAGMARLRQRVFKERLKGLVRLAYAELALRHDLDRERRQQRAYFADLSRIA